MCGPHSSPDSKKPSVKCHFFLNNQEILMYYVLDTINKLLIVVERHCDNFKILT